MDLFSSKISVIKHHNFHHYGLLWEFSNPKSNVTIMVSDGEIIQYNKCKMLWHEQPMTTAARYQSFSIPQVTADKFSNKSSFSPCIDNNHSRDKTNHNKITQLHIPQVQDLKEGKPSMDQTRLNQRLWNWERMCRGMA